MTDNLYNLSHIHPPLFGHPTSALVGEVTTTSVGVGRDLPVGRFVNQLGYLLAQELDMDHPSVSRSGESGGAFGPVFRWPSFANNLRLH